MKKKFYQKKWFIALVVLFILSMIFGTSKTENNEDSTQNTVPKEQHKEVLEENTTTETEIVVEEVEKDISIDEVFIESVKNAIQDAIASDDEKITEVALANKELRVYVDLSQADPSPLTLEDLAFARTSSITDNILDLTEYEYLWETIVIDFGELGSISNKKDEMVQNEYGMYYFPTENFKLEK